jgi:hypothetical protein
VISLVKQPGVRRYKAILAEVTAAAAELRENDRRRAAELKRLLVGLDDEMLHAGERATLSGVGVQLHWEAALDKLWQEAWMKLRPRPAPNPDADPDELATLDAELARRYTELEQAVRRRWYELPTNW